MMRMRRAVFRALSHDVLTLSKSAAYSAILALFPALLVVTTVLAMMPRSSRLTGEMRDVILDLLPQDTVSAVHTYFQTRHVHTVQAIISAVLVCLFGSMGMMTSFMEGFRRAYDLPKNDWKFWRERLVALLLIPSCVIPLALATVFVAFGHQIETWILGYAFGEVRAYVRILWRLTRWAAALSTTAVVFAVIYRYGVAHPLRWRRVLPGALGATLLWFVTTLSYGWYITRFADYSVVYGPFGTAIATLVWLYITSLSVFVGAEYNALLFAPGSAIAGKAAAVAARSGAAREGSAGQAVAFAGSPADGGADGLTPARPSQTA
jgi:membrane protein